jgi:uncharacterized protein
VSRFEELTRKVDGFFARVTVRHGTDMQCATGCSDCCHVRLTITAVEAAAIRAHVTAWPGARRSNLADIGPADRCAALDPGGRCKIYEARPLVCRSHGLPIRMRRGSLPVVQACPHNFTHTTPDPDCVLDQATLSATLLAVDAAEARVSGNPAVPRPGALRPAAGSAADEVPTRIDLAGLLADLAAV